jgi:hypothetical protein
MASKLGYLSSEHATLRVITEGYARRIGAEGLAAYVTSQDLLVLTDMYSILMMTQASKYVKMHRLRAIEHWTKSRGELPGIQIVNPDVTHDSNDIRLKSMISERSIYAGELIALAMAQSQVDQRFRRSLVPYESGDEKLVTLRTFTGVELHVSKLYYSLLLDHRKVQVLSGVEDNFQEPTVTWRDLPLASKGVFFMADATFYGLVMPHAPINVSISKVGDN